MTEFNTEMATIEIELWEAGVEYNHDGEVAFVDTPYAMGFSEDDTDA